ncbi:GTP-binding protein Obg/CgtA [Polychaeton citri CBS 116435]|uniref:GTP-binding protein Obg/CgtA n=1 Tax=Polychaeton citri CBS 116435 TaxID=1314669 RepID=A0A9P4Q760_9PEZI|nr:GTP-binding protein Obg/CgtA [Polychaeton citri CBS 116435]
MSGSVRPASLLSPTLTPFLYPCLDGTWIRARTCTSRRILRSISTTVAGKPPVDIHQYDHLDPSPPEYTTNLFTDSTTLTLHAGSGGHGCISFLREKYIANGPANGGDGGTGGSIYIQAVGGETSLHKLARRSILKAGRGKNGQGRLKGGSRGEDLLVTVPVGTVVREVWRKDPVAEEEALDWEERRARRRRKGKGRDMKDDENNEPLDPSEDQSSRWRRDKWLLYPGALPSWFSSADFPALPRPRRSNLAMSQPPAPINLDLDKPMDTPMLLAAGAMGGLGNPHFVTKSIMRPKFATKGDEGMKVQLQLELKLLADVGLVGLPNAGKSTLLRSLTGSRARVGDWAFTTLSPNIGTFVLDNYRGRPSIHTNGSSKEPRTNFTIADIPGLIEDAHQDRGLGLGFLRHIERAAVLCFVVDLGAGDAVQALKGLWKEVSEYEILREREVNAESERATEHTEGVIPSSAPSNHFASGEEELLAASNAEGGSATRRQREEDIVLDPQVGRQLPKLSLPPISSKPWFVVATKADLPSTQENFVRLQQYVNDVEASVVPHPSEKKNAWRKKLAALPVSAVNREGVDGIPTLVLELLD